MEGQIKNYDDLINSIIRPPRESYTMKDLGPKEMKIKGKKYVRKDVGLVNSRGDTLECSHYQPHPDERINKILPCVVFCHGNCGSRMDALPLVLSLLPHNITVFAMDFSGSGRSDGDYVSLGWFEKDDLNSAIEYLRSQTSVSSIGLWGQSMGAVTCILYASEDPLIAGMVLDSPFANLKTLCLELCRAHSKIPLFFCKIALKFIRRSILKKAGFDMNKLDVLKYAKKCFSPCRIFYPDLDDFVDPSHSEKLYLAYGGDKNLTEFEGEHNTERPQFFYDSGTIFFQNIMMSDKIVDERVNKSPTAQKEKAKELLKDGKIPEFDSTKFQKLDDMVNQEEDEDDTYQFDQSMYFRKKSNIKMEFRKKVKEEAKEVRDSLIESMNEHISEQEKEKHIIDTLDQIGLFKQLSLEGNMKALFKPEDLEVDDSIPDDKVIIEAMKDRQELGTSENSMASTDS